MTEPIPQTDRSPSKRTAWAWAGLFGLMSVVAMLLAPNWPNRHVLEDESLGQSVFGPWGILPGICLALPLVGMLGAWRRGLNVLFACCLVSGLSVGAFDLTLAACSRSIDFLGGAPLFWILIFGLPIATCFGLCQGLMRLFGWLVRPRQVIPIALHAAIAITLTLCLVVLQSVPMLHSFRFLIPSESFLLVPLFADLGYSFSTTMTKADPNAPQDKWDRLLAHRWIRPVAKQLTDGWFPQLLALALLGMLVVELSGLG